MYLLPLPCPASGGSPTAQGEGRGGQKWRSGARLGIGLDKPGLLLATPPRWPVKIEEERDLGRAN